MSSNTIDTVRQQKALTDTAKKDVALAELDGFQLPVDVTEEMLDWMKKASRFSGWPTPDILSKANYNH